MGWIIFVAGAVLSWGAYGALLHMGQTQLGNPLKALLCVGVAYFLIGVIIPVIALELSGQPVEFQQRGPRSPPRSPARSAPVGPPASSGRFEPAACRST